MNRSKSRMLEYIDGFYQMPPILGRGSFLYAFIVFFTLYGQINASFSFSAEPPIQILNKNTHSRLSIRLEKNKKVQFSTHKNIFEVFIPETHLTDLGVPFGSEKEWVQQLEKMVLENPKEQRLRKISAEETKNGVKITGEWKFLEGETSPAEKAMETFDYWNYQEKSYYVVDFWQKKGPSVAEVKKQKAIEDRQKKLEQANKESQLRADKRIQYENKVKYLTDLSSACKDPWSVENNIPLLFAPVHEPIDLKKWIKLPTPDAEYSYRVPELDDKESEYIRLALQLYESGKFALTLKVIDFYSKKYKNTSQKVEIDFLKSNALYKLGYISKAESLLAEIVQNHPEHSVALHANLFLAVQDFSKGEYLKSLEKFNQLKRNHSDHRLLWLIHFASAEALYSIRQTMEAGKEYLITSEKTQDKSIQAEVNFRTGDMYLMRNQYEQALASYYRTIKAFPEEAQNYSAVHLNRAESLLQLDDIKRAEEAFKEYTKKFTRDTNGWRAYWRLAEMSTLKPSSLKNDKSKDYLIALINQFPFTIGESLARAKLYECYYDPKVDLTTLSDFFQTQLAKVKNQNIIEEKKYADFLNIAHIRSLSHYGKYELLVQLALDKLSVPMGLVAYKETKRILNQAFRLHILSLLEKNEPFKAISYYEQVLPLIKENYEPIYADFLLALAKVAAEKNLGNLSLKFMDSFHKYSENSVVSRSLASVKDDDSLFTKFNKSKELFTESLASWTSGAAQSDPSQFIEKLEKMSDESENGYLKHILLAKIKESQNKYKEAIQNITQALVLMTDKNMISSQTLDFWMIQLYQLEKKDSHALSLLNKLQEDENYEKVVRTDLESTLKLPILPSLKKLYLNEIAIFEAQEDWLKAVAVYEKMDEKNLADPEVYYNYAMALRKSKADENLNKSNSVLTKIIEKDKNSFWAERAQDALTYEMN